MTEEAVGNSAGSAETAEIAREPSVKRRRGDVVKLELWSQNRQKSIINPDQNSRQGLNQLEV